MEFLGVATIPKNLVNEGCSTRGRLEISIKFIDGVFGTVSISKDLLKAIYPQGPFLKEGGKGSLDILMLHYASLWRKEREMFRRQIYDLIVIPFPCCFSHSKLFFV